MSEPKAREGLAAGHVNGTAPSANGAGGFDAAAETLAAVSAAVAAPAVDVPQVDAEELLSFSADDEGNAQATYTLYGHVLRFAEEIGWLWYTGTHWSHHGADARASRATTETMKLRRQLAVQHEREAIVKATRASRPRVTGAKAQLADLLTVSIESFNLEPDLLNCRNGVLDLRTGELSPHEPAQRFTYCIPTEYDAGASWALWETFLRQVIGDDDELLDYLQTAVGYTLTGYTNEEILFYLFGPQRSGKGTFTETLRALLGKPLSAGVRFEMMTRDRSGDANNADLASLHATRYITASESTRYTALRPDVVKSITGGDYLQVAHKYGKFFDFRPQFKLWLTSNWPLNLDVDEDPAWGRVKVIGFPNSHAGNEDKTLKLRLRAPEALRGLLAWAAEGARRWYAAENGLETPAAVEQLGREHRAQLDTIQQFLDECCNRTPGAIVPNSRLYAAYEEWATDNGITPRKAKSFTQALNRKGLENKQARHQGRTQRCWMDVDLLTEEVRL